MLKREWGAENNGKLPHLFISSKTATLVPEFAMEDLSLGRIAALVPEFAVKDLPLGRTLMMMMIKRRKIYWLGHWPAEGCSRRNGKREESSRQKKISDDRQHYDKWIV